MGAEGRVAGADISTGMLEQAKRKIEAANLNKIELILASAEYLNFPDSSFDTVLCGSALILFANIPAALRSWHRLLKPGGMIAFNGFAETSFIAGVVLSQVAHKYGVEFAFNRATGSAHKCGDLLRDAGFEDVEVKTDRGGNYLSLNQAQALWDINLKHPLARPLLQLDSEQLERVKAEYCADLEALVTDKGIWNDITTFTALGRKKASRIENLAHLSAKTGVRPPSPVRGERQASGQEWAGTANAGCTEREVPIASRQTNYGNLARTSRTSGSIWGYGFWSDAPL